MIEEITLKNFRTHKSTTIKLKPVTLLIGNNNSGKTNFLAGVQHFCSLLRKAERSERSQGGDDRIAVEAQDYFPHQHRLTENNAPMSISIRWSNPQERNLMIESVPPGKITYEMTLYESQELSKLQVGCKQKITIELANTGQSITERIGYDTPSNLINLEHLIGTTSSLPEAEKNLCRLFFRDFTGVATYHLQPWFLKHFDKNGKTNKSVDPLTILHLLGYEGRNFQELLLRIKENDERTFSRFMALMRRFERGFHGVRYDPVQSSPIWEFDLGRKQLVDEFIPDVVSDGFLKAAAIGLLVSLSKQPALIMLEEIENGINPGNIQELMYWIWQATSLNQEGYASQFILTSHSPGVLREFHDHLDHVYTFHLDKRRFQSDVRNLNDTLDTLIGIGTIEGDIDEETGVVNVPRYQLADLWYSGAIG